MAIQESQAATSAPAGSGTDVFARASARGNPGILSRNIRAGREWHGRLCEGVSPWQSRNPKPQHPRRPGVARTSLRGRQPVAIQEAKAETAVAVESPAGGSRRRSAPRDDVMRKALLAMT